MWTHVPLYTAVWVDVTSHWTTSSHLTSSLPLSSIFCSNIDRKPCVKSSPPLPSSAAILLSLTCIYVDGVYVMYLQSSHPVAHAQACHFCWTACSIKPCIERIANLFVYMTYYISSFMTSKASCLHACIYWSRWWKFSGFLCVHFCCTSSSPSWGGKR